MGVRAELLSRGTHITQHSQINETLQPVFLRVSGCGLWGSWYPTPLGVLKGKGASGGACPSFPSPTGSCLLDGDVQGMWSRGPVAYSPNG